MVNNAPNCDGLRIIARLGSFRIMVLSKRIVLALAAAALLPVAHANAADYDPPVYVEPAEEYVPVEVGSGWYLRGDLGYVADKSYRDRERIVTHSRFADFWPMDLTYSSVKDTPVFGSVGFGYHFNDFLRGDLNAGVLGGSKFGLGGNARGGCGGTETITTTRFDSEGGAIEPDLVRTRFGTRDCVATLNSKNTYWTGLANGYIDLGTFAGLTPYIGGGLGVVYSKTTLNGGAICRATSSTQANSSASTTTTFLCDGQTSVSDSGVEYLGTRYTDRKYSLLYAANAGFSYQVAKNTSIDVGYQYLNSPEARWIKLDKDGGPKFGKDIDYHTIKLGLRYDLW